MIQALCRKCHAPFTRYSTLDRLCPNCRTGFKPVAKPMKQKGKVGKQWDKDRVKWLKDTNTGNDTWYCRVGGARLTNNKYLLEYGYLPIEVDHEIARTRDQSKRSDQGNLGSMCHKHNTDKGSRSLDEYLASKPDMTCG